MEKAKGGKGTAPRAARRKQPIIELAQEDAKEAAVEKRIKHIRAEVAYFILAFVAITAFVGVFGAARVWAAVAGNAVKFQVPYYSAAAKLVGAKNMWNNGMQVGISTVSSRWSFSNRNPLETDTKKNGVLTIDGDIKLSSIRTSPEVKDGRLYNLNGDLWWDNTKIGLWTKFPTGGTYPDVIYRGNVGIGTETPDAKLAVVYTAANAGAVVGDNHTATFYAPEIGQDESVIHWGATGDWLIRSASRNGNVVMQDYGGNVGVGTITPAEKFSVVGNSRFDGTVTINDNATVNSTLTVNGNSVISGTLTVGGKGTFAEIQTTGIANVGGALSVSGVANFGSAVTMSGTLNVSGATILSGTLNVGNKATFNETLTNATATFNGIATFKKNVIFEKNLGVNVANPLERFEVGGNIKTNYAVKAGSAVITGDVSANNITTAHAILGINHTEQKESQGQLTLKPANTNQTWWFIRNDDKNVSTDKETSLIFARAENGGEDKMRIDNAGIYWNIAVAGATPNWKPLMVSSDARLKKNVCSIDGSLNKIMKLSGVKFNWRRDEFPDRYLPAGDQLGFIAQDVEKVLPELIGTDGQGFKNVNYDGVIPVLVNAMKEQQQQIDQLKAEVAKLKAKK